MLLSGLKDHAKIIELRTLSVPQVRTCIVSSHSFALLLQHFPLEDFLPHHLALVIEAVFRGPSYLIRTSVSSDRARSRLMFHFSRSQPQEGCTQLKTAERRHPDTEALGHWQRVIDLQNAMILRVDGGQIIALQCHELLATC